MTDIGRLNLALAKARLALLAARVPSGHWEGELSSSALSTATAVCALAIWWREHSNSRTDGKLATQLAAARQAIDAGLAWLATHANTDGGWGDTIYSVSNISTTTLGWAAFGVVPGADERHRPIVGAAAQWLARTAGGCEPARLVPAIVRRYGKDRTFSVPILTMCALSGRFGEGPEAWEHVLPLPFELAAFPPTWFAALRLPVVSYALPALIAIGQARHYHRPSRNPLIRWVRNSAKARTLEVLTRIQPTSGGFLEATPLTSFVAMSLAASGQADHVVVRQGVEFLLASRRPDGSWPIDTNLATWVTTLSVNALGAGPASSLSEIEQWKIRDWLIGQQYRTVHPYTNSPPGGWAWTDLTGGVPDADDTAGALLALRRLGKLDEPVTRAAEAGVEWLLNLQNGDGGMPTFCRGWGTLPFDRSSPDLTAHALRAWTEWRADLPVGLHGRLDRACDHAIGYLAEVQRTDGSWIPLWFGHQHAPDDINPTYGTARVLQALPGLVGGTNSRSKILLEKGVDWLVGSQTEDGGWSGFGGGISSVEETALAVEALADCLPALGVNARRLAVERAIESGTVWLLERIESGAWTNPSPIGFYFAKLWYYERLYPMIFAVGALERVAWGKTND